jgi:transposase
LGVRYHPGHVSRLLKQLGWTPQVPITRAIQRDEAEIQRWRDEVWPELKQRARSESRHLVFVDESGVYLLPGLVRTEGRKRHTPVVKQCEARDHLSVMAGLTTTGQVYTLVRQEALTGLEVIAFLTHLGHQLNGAALVIWDRSPIHRRSEVNEFIAAIGARALQVELLPPYAPDLNPVEWLWRHLKKVEMANLACRDQEELHGQFHLAVARVRGKPRLVPSFFAGAGLDL